MENVKCDQQADISKILNRHWKTTEDSTTYRQWMTTNRSILQTTAQCCGNCLQPQAAAAPANSIRESARLILWIIWKVFLPCTRFSKGEGFHWSNIPQSSSTGRLCTKLNNKACQICSHIRLLQMWHCSYTYVQSKLLSFLTGISQKFTIILAVLAYSTDMTIFNLSHHKDQYDNNEEWNFFVT